MRRVTGGYAECPFHTAADTNTWRPNNDAQVRAWQLQRYGESYLRGGEQATFLELITRVGAVLGKKTPRRATPAFALRGGTLQGGASIIGWRSTISSIEQGRANR